MNNPPDVIYLQWYGFDDVEEFDSYDEFPYEGITWCEDRINGKDVEYCQITKTELERLRSIEKMVEDMDKE